MYYFTCRCECSTPGPVCSPLQPVRLHPRPGEGGWGGASPDAARGGNQDSPATSGTSLPWSVSWNDRLSQL